jgi:hypothetical protein
MVALRSEICGTQLGFIGEQAIFLYCRIFCFTAVSLPLINIVDTSDCTNKRQKKVTKLEL